MRARVKSALLMVPLLAIIYVGGIVLAAGVAVLSAFALREFASGFAEKGGVAWRATYRVCMASLAVLYLGPVAVWLLAGASEGLDHAIDASSYPYQLGHMLAVFPIWAFVSVMLCLVSMFWVGRRTLPQAMSAFAGVFYIVLCAFAIVMLDSAAGLPYVPLFAHADGFGDSGLWLAGFGSPVWIVVFGAFGSDIFAFLTGSLCGRHKLCEHISPKKTREGAVGGIVGGALLCGVFELVCVAGGAVDGRLLAAVALGAVAAVASQFGDLSASVLKRGLGIKDWGSAIPGHGGVLDRIDSILFAAPAVYCVYLASVIAGSW